MAFALPPIPAANPGQSGPLLDSIQPPASSGFAGNILPPMGGMPPGMPMPGAMTPADMQYETQTQADGTVLLFVKNPDGSRGPAVRIVPAPKQPKQPGVA